MAFSIYLDLWSLFGGSFLAATLLPGGSEVVFALLAVKNIHPPPVLIGVATLGNTLGGVVTLGMGRFVARRYPMRVLEQPSQRRASALLHQYGPFSLLLSWVPIIGDPLCFVAGWLRLNFFLGVVLIAAGKGVRYAALWSMVG